jgi:hypothetical protein
VEPDVVVEGGWEAVADVLGETDEVEPLALATVGSEDVVPDEVDAAPVSCGASRYCRLNGFLLWTCSKRF